MQLFSDLFLENVKKNMIDTLNELVVSVKKDCVVNCRYLNKKDACKYVNISRPTLNEWISMGLPVVRVGNVERIDVKDIDLFLVKNKK